MKFYHETLAIYLETKLIVSWLRDSIGYLAPCLLNDCNMILEVKL